MSDGTGAGFLYVRFCFGFVDGHPGPHLTKLPEADFETALKQEVADSVRLREREFEEWLEQRQRRLEDARREQAAMAISRPAAARRSSVGGIRLRGNETRTNWDEFVDRLSFLGLIAGAPAEGQLASHRIFLADDLAADEAEKAIAALEYATGSSAKSKQLRSVLCPRYGYIAADEVSFKECVQFREGMRQFWSGPQASQDCWYRFARQLHPDNAAILYAVGRHGAGDPSWVRTDCRNSSLGYSPEQETEMKALLDSIRKGWLDPGLTAAERVAFEIQQFAAYVHILEHPIETPVDAGVLKRDGRETAGEESAERRLSVRLDPPQVTLSKTVDSTPDAFGLTCDEAACLNCLPSDGHWISGTAITESTSIARPERKFKAIREKTGVDFIESMTGKGHRIRQEWLA